MKLRKLLKENEESYLSTKSKDYQDGYEDGKEDGYEEGQEVGYESRL
jgi:flagellar biosynthesis/type III secretory pathway protein FliH